MPDVLVGATLTRLSRTLASTGGVGQYSAAVTAPANGYSTSSTAITINAKGFDSAGGSVRLLIELSTSSSFSTIADSAVYASVASGSEQVWNKTGLATGTRYYVRATASNVGNTIVGPSSVAITFTADVKTADAYCYFYENVGANPAPDSRGHCYFFENVGLSFTTYQDAAFYGFMNVGVTRSTVGNNWYYFFLNNTTDVPTPAIWFLDPNRGSPLDSFVIVGSGFGDLQSTYNGAAYLLDGATQIPLGITSWQTFPASPLAFSIERAIDPTTLRSTDFSDSFDEAASSLGTGWLYAGLGTWSQIGGQAAPPSASGDMYAYRVFASADGVISLTIPEHTNAAGIVFRYQDSNNYWRWIPYARSLVRRVSGSDTVVASNLGSTTPAEGVTFAVQLAGTTITLYVDGVQVYQNLSATQFSDQANHGMYATRGTNRFDSFAYTSPLPPSLAADPQHGEIGVILPLGAEPPGYPVQVETDA
jgi:hypothetical protein